MKKTSGICLSIIILAMILMSSCFVSAAAYKVTKVNSGEYRLYYNNTHFASILNSGGTFVIRPHPGLDINGWGSSLYLQPFLPGAVLRGTTIGSITATTDKIKVSVTGKVAKGASSNYGNWNSAISFTFDPVNREVKGTGTYTISLSGKLSTTTGDLNLYKLASNYLDDVPLLNGSIGDTGDISYVEISGNGLNTKWNPSLQPGYFPIEEMTSISVNALGDYNQVDTVKQGYNAIKAAYKPTIKISLTPYSNSYVVPIVFGGYYNTAQSKYFWADNVGITPLILKKNTKTGFKFNVQISSTPIAGDSNWNGTNPIKCYKSSDCGIDSFSQNFCVINSVVHNTTSYTCNNPGTTSSYCTSSFIPAVYEFCEYGCSNGACIPSLPINASSCVVPFDRMIITQDTNLCTGRYYLPNGIKIANNNVVLNCNYSRISGNYTTYGVYGDNLNNITIKNCYLDVMSGMGIFNSRNILIENNSFWRYTIYANGTNITIRYNEVARIMATGTNINVYGNNVENTGEPTTIACTSDSQCGTNNWLGEFYCSAENVLGSYRIFTCMNPGTTSSYCTYNVINRTNKTCAIGCYNGQCTQAICGNGVKEGSEQCDDGNLVNGDGCSSSCTIETPSCVTPINGMNITSDTVFCKGTYDLPDGINILSGSVTLDCNGAVIRGNSTPGSTGILAGSYKGQNTIKNCVIEKFSKGIFNYNGYRHNYVNNVFTNNICGIWLEASYDDIIQANNFTGNSGGVMVYWYNSGEIIKNNIFENNQYGFATAWGSNNNEVINNTFKGNSNAIADGGSYDRITGSNVYSYNTLVNNNKGIFIQTYCNGDLIAQNTLINNSYGVHILGANNTVLLNNFITNTIQAENSATTIWNMNSKGNYWSDYDSSNEGCLDNNNDGICDAPYKKSPGVLDNFASVKAL